MATSNPICFLFLIFSCCLLLNFTPASASELCSDSFCHRSETTIRFPFRLKSLPPSSCGYPGFDLFCDAFNRTVIDLPNTGRFTVRHIDYSKQSIWLNDHEKCLPGLLLKLNLTGSPFNGFFFQNFTFFNCSFDYRKYRFNPVACLSGDNYTVFASSSGRDIGFLKSKCRLMATVAVPVDRDFFEPVATSDLSGDIRLTWDSPRCRRCESRGGRCGLRSSNSTAIECSRNVASRGLPRSATYAIVVGAGVPSFLCLLGLVCLICSRLKRFGRRHHPIMDFSLAMTQQPTTTMSGLDGATIESYPKTILGESRRLPKPEQSVCSICLSEYMPQETLRSIPECQHCFHADCVDEWLRLNPSCPVCRNSPKPPPPTLAS